MGIDCGGRREMAVLVRSTDSVGTIRGYGWGWKYRDCGDGGKDGEQYERDGAFGAAGGRGADVFACFHDVVVFVPSSVSFIGRSGLNAFESPLPVTPPPATSLVPSPSLRTKPVTPTTASSKTRHASLVQCSLYPSQTS
jgi:hypothetical protein